MQGEGHGAPPTISTGEPQRISSGKVHAVSDDASIGTDKDSVRDLLSRYFQVIDRDLSGKASVEELQRSVDLVKQVHVRVREKASDDDTEAGRLPKRWRGTVPTGIEKLGGTESLKALQVLFDQSVEHAAGDGEVSVSDVMTVMSADDFHVSTQELVEALRVALDVLTAQPVCETWWSNLIPAGLLLLVAWGFGFPTRKRTSLTFTRTCVVVLTCARCFLPGASWRFQCMARTRPVMCFIGVRGRWRVGLPIRNQARHDRLARPWNPRRHAGAL